MKSCPIFFTMVVSFALNVQSQTWRIDSSKTVQNLYGATEQHLTTTLYIVGTAGTIQTSEESFLTKASSIAIAGAWTSQNSGTTAALYSTFSSVLASYAIGVGGTILKIPSSSYTWTPLTSGVTASLYSGFFSNSLNGYVVGGGGIILKTTNGGTTWSSLASGTNQTLYSVYFTDTANGFAVGGNGTLIKTINGGTTWSSQISGTTQTLYSISFVNSTAGYAVGTGGTMIKTTNGGASWSPQASGTTRTLRSIGFGLFYPNGTNPATSIGCIVGDSGTILWTATGGTSWATENSGTTRNLNAVSVSSATEIAVGNGGIILEKDIADGTIIPLAFGPRQSFAGSRFYDLQGRRLIQTSPGFSVLEFGSGENQRLLPLLQTNP